MSEHLISTDDNGNLVFIYDDAIAFLSDLGDAETKRASHVEPAANGKWEADMSPVDGPVLGPFDFRQQALTAETDWIRTNIL